MQRNRLFYEEADIFQMSPWSGNVCFPDCENLLASVLRAIWTISSPVEDYLPWTDELSLETYKVSYMIWSSISQSTSGTGGRTAVLFLNLLCGKTGLQQMSLHLQRNWKFRSLKQGGKNEKRTKGMQEKGNNTMDENIRKRKQFVISFSVQGTWGSIDSAAFVTQATLAA